MKYEAIIYRNGKDKAFIVEVPELPGCAADGKTYKEALANVEVIIGKWIETCAADSATRRQIDVRVTLPSIE